jgi:hypothetical protein
LSAFGFLLSEKFHGSKRSLHNGNETADIADSLQTDNYFTTTAEQLQAECFSIYWKRNLPICEINHLSPFSSSINRVTIHTYAAATATEVAAGRIEIRHPLCGVACPNHPRRFAPLLRTQYHCKSDPY